MRRLAARALARVPPEPRQRLTQDRGRQLSLGLLLLYVVGTELLIGLRSEHLALVALSVACVLWGGRPFSFLKSFSPVILTGISYDYFRLLTPLRGEIHVADLYRAELALFGIGEGAGRQIPADWMLSYTHPVADFVAGVAYLTYLTIPMGLAIALFFLDRRRMALVGWAFFCTNLVGIVVYLAFPAAPPWYVADYGLGPADLSAVPSAAGAARFDALIGMPIFEGFYERSANVFGAMPSLHVAYPASATLAMWGMGKRWVAPLASFTLVVAVSAIYLQHHYILDVLAGIACAAVAVMMARWARRRPDTQSEQAEPDPMGSQLEAPLA